MPEDLEPFLQDGQFQEGKGDMTSKDFLKRVEVLMKKKTSHSSLNPNANTNPSTTDLLHATNELRIATDQHQLQQHQQQQQQQQHQHQYEDMTVPPAASYNHPQHLYQNTSSSSIYAQQQYLPYPNRHPLSDFVPSPIATTRHSSLHNHQTNSTGNATATTSPTSPNGYAHSGSGAASTHSSQLYHQHHYLHQQQHYQQQQHHSLTDSASPSDYSPSHLRSTPQELQS